MDVLSQVIERIEKDAERTFLIDSLSERSFSYAEFDALARDLALSR